MDSYYLPNGKKIDMDGCVTAVLSASEYPMYFLDTQSGNVCIIDSSRALVDLVERIGTSRRYFEITHFDDEEFREIVHNFLKDIIATMASQRLYFKLVKTLDKRGWKETLVELERDNEGWIHGWSQYIHDEGYERAVDWVMNIPDVNVTEKFEGFDDCEICKTMVEGENSYGDLTESFSKQKAKLKKLNENKQKSKRK